MGITDKVITIHSLTVAPFIIRRCITKLKRWAGTVACSSFFATFAPYYGNEHIYGACNVVLKLDGEKVAVTSASPQYMEWDVVSSAPQRIGFSGTGELTSYTAKRLTAGKHTMTLELEYSLTPGSAERMNSGWSEDENLYKLYGNVTEDSGPCCWNLGNINCTLTYTPIE